MGMNFFKPSVEFQCMNEFYHNMTSLALFGAVWRLEGLFFGRVENKLHWGLMLLCGLHSENLWSHG